MKILYFAKVREFIGYAEEEINLPSDIKTVDDVLDYLISKDCLLYTSDAADE